MCCTNQLPILRPVKMLVLAPVLTNIFHYVDQFFAQPMSLSAMYVLVEPIGPHNFALFITCKGYIVF